VSRPPAAAARILGLDPGSRHTGYGLVEKAGSRLAFLEAGDIAPARGLDTPLLLRDLHRRVGQVMDRGRPDVVAVEDLFHHARDARAALRLAQVRGVLLLAAGERDLPVVSYPPATIKKTVVGSGRADKDQVAWMVSRMLPDAPAEERRDVTDALAIALCHAYHQRGGLTVSRVAGGRAGRLTLEDLAALQAARKGRR
jgi:crossover junction endodeoxyribonuclease RuvC